MIITSLDNDRIKKYAKLNDKKERDNTKLFLVEGEHLVLEAYKSGCIKELVLVENTDFSLDTNTIYVTSDVMRKLSSLDTPSNMMAVCQMNDSSELIGNRILLLDGIQDPGNLGTIIRSALSFNVSTIVLGNNTVDIYNSKVLRSTQGMNFHINIISADLINTIESLHKNNFIVYGTDVDNGKDIRDITYNKNEKLALVMGSEGQGIKREVKELCDDNLYISINKQVESLNVAVATSILLYELDRRS